MVTFLGLSATQEASLIPNLLVTLDGYAVRWGEVAKRAREEIRRADDGTYGLTGYKDGPEDWQESWSTETATHVGGSEESDPFRILVRWIRQGVELGRTSHVGSFDRYFEGKSRGQSRRLLAFPKLTVANAGGDRRCPRERW